MVAHHHILALPATARPRLPLSMAKVHQVNLPMAVNRHTLQLPRHTSKVPATGNLHKPLNMALTAHLPTVASNTVNSLQLAEKLNPHSKFCRISRLRNNDC